MSATCLGFNENLKEFKEVSKQHLSRLERNDGMHLVETLRQLLDFGARLCLPLDAQLSLPSSGLSSHGDSRSAYGEESEN